MLTKNLPTTIVVFNPKTLFSTDIQNVYFKFDKACNKCLKIFNTKLNKANTNDQNLNIGCIKTQ